MGLTLKIAKETDPGRERDLNEDAVLAEQRILPDGRTMAVLMVSDGMGGHEGGEVASALAIETVRTRLGWPAKRLGVRDTQPLPTFMANDGGANAIRLQLAVEEANSVIVDYAKANHTTVANMGATTTVVLIDDNEALIANVGDSRAYLLRAGKLIQLTEDHSYVAQLVRIGQLSAESIFDHPNRSVITRALGDKACVKVDITVKVLQPNDVLMLCTDGLWEMVRDEREIADILQNSADVSRTARTLIDRANYYGGHDNIGVVVAKMS